MQEKRSKNAGKMQRNGGKMAHIRRAWPVLALSDLTGGCRTFARPALSSFHGPAVNGFQELP
jgi:hypothetical protein